MKVEGVEAKNAGTDAVVDEEVAGNGKGPHAKGAEAVAGETAEDGRRASGIPVEESALQKGMNKLHDIRRRYARTFLLPAQSEG